MSIREDPFGRGVAASIIGIVALDIADYFMMLINISKTPLWEAGGAVLLSENALKEPLGIAIGFASHMIVAMFVGIAISYFLYITGTNFSILKGIGLSFIALYIVLVLVFPFRGLSTEMENSPPDVLSAFIDHSVFGGIVAYTVAVLQKKEIFEQHSLTTKQTLNPPARKKKVRKNVTLMKTLSRLK